MMKHAAYILCIGAFIALAVGCVEGSKHDTAFRKAAEEIAARDTWPPSPENVSEAFWEARYAKDYPEMEILWPGSAGTVNWADVSASDDPDVRYVFGAARTFTTERNAEVVQEAEVPYAAEKHFQDAGDYNLTMRLRALDTPHGPRWYVYSGN